MKGENITIELHPWMGLIPGVVFGAVMHHFYSLERAYIAVLKALNERDEWRNKFMESESLAGAALDELDRMELECREL